MNCFIVKYHVFCNNCIKEIESGTTNKHICLIEKKEELK
jgi:hypothetical protein